MKTLPQKLLIVFIIIICGKILSFLRDITITSTYGANATIDSYFVANNVPSLLFTAILSSYLVYLIPTYKRLQVKNGNFEADIFASRLLNFFILFSVSLSLIGILFSKQLISIIAFGFNKEQQAFTVSICKILLLSFPFSSVSLLLANISNANNKYFSIQIIPIISSIIVILSLFIFSDEYGIYALIYSSVFSFIIQLVIQIIIAKKDFKYTPLLFPFDANIKKITFLVFPIFLGYSIDQINNVITSTICTTLEEGSVSIFNYAIKLQNTINSTISLAIITVMYPLLSKLFSEEKYKKFSMLFSKSIKIILLTIIPIACFLCIFSNSIISLIYGRGAFDVISITKTANVFSFLAISVIFLSLRDIFIRIYYIENDSWSPLISSFLFAFFNLCVGLLLVKHYNIYGLAFANLTGSIICISYLFFKIKKKTSKFNCYIYIRMSFIKKVFISLLICSIVVLTLDYLIKSDSILYLLFYMCIYFFLFYAILYIQKEQLIHSYVYIYYNKIKKSCQFLKTKHY